MRSFSLLYAFTKIIFSPSVRIFYRRIRVGNYNCMPGKGPVLICCNHVNAFMDAITVQLFNKRQLFSLARGDAFKKPFMRMLLTGWKIIPIYRLSEGLENLKKNDETFAVTEDVLLKGNPLIIYPEAICVQERRIRKLKKGAARIVFGFGERTAFRENLPILPVGMNYSDPPRFRSELYMNFGIPLNSSDYYDLYQQDKAKAINQLTHDIEQAMKNLVVNVENKVNDALVQVLFDVYKPELMHVLGLKSPNPKDDFKAGNLIVTKLNHLQKNHSPLLETVRDSLFSYCEKIKIICVNERMLSKKNSPTLNAGRIAMDCTGIILGLILFIPGVLTNYLPYRIGNTVANKLARNIEFHASISLVIGWFSWIIYFILQLTIASRIFHNVLITGIAAAAIPITGFYSLYFSLFLRSCRDRRRVFMLKKRNPERVADLQKEREQLMHLLNSTFLPVPEA